MSQDKANRKETGNVVVITPFFSLLLILKKWGWSESVERGWLWQARGVGGQRVRKQDREQRKKKNLRCLLDRFGIASAEVFVVRDGLKIHCFSHSHLSTWAELLKGGGGGGDDSDWRHPDWLYSWTACQHAPHPPASNKKLNKCWIVETMSMSTTKSRILPPHFLPTF